MLVEHHGWHSPRLGRGMGIDVYGHYGAPIVVFPTSGGDEREYAGQGMIEALAHWIDAGRVKLYCVDTVNNQSWYDKGAHPRHRSYMQAMYDAYVAEEVAPFVAHHCQSPGIGITTTGASFGAYHAANTLFKHPDKFKRCLALSGVYDIRRFMDGDYDDNFYFNNPVDYVAGPIRPLVLRPPRELRHSPGDGQRALRGLGSDFPFLRGLEGEGDRPLRGRLGRRRRARLALLEAADERVPGAPALVGDRLARRSPVGNGHSPKRTGRRAAWPVHVPSRKSGRGVSNVTDLKGDLATLKIDRVQPARSPWRWPLLFFVPIVLALGALYALRVQQAMAAPEVETAVAAVSRGGTEPDAGTPILTASGYVVARRKAVVSSKIQGRLAELRVEEGSRVRQGEVFARLESTDYEASVRRAQAAVQRAEADLGEAEAAARSFRAARQGQGRLRGHRGREPQQGPHSGGPGRAERGRPPVLRGRASTTPRSARPSRASW